MMMKVIKVMSFEEPEGMKLMEVPVINAGIAQVVIAVEASGVGYVDVLARKGLFPGFSEPGFVPGVEVAGRVIHVGEKVDKNWLGQRVFALTPFGGYAQQVAVDVAALARIPQQLSATNAIALGVNALVAEFSLQRAACQPEQKVLIRGAGGGIGSMTVLLALLKGASVTAMVSSPEKRQKLEGVGVHNFIQDGQETNSTDAYDSIIDPVAGSSIEAFVKKLRPNGHYIINGVAGGLPNSNFGSSLVASFQKSLTLSFVSLNSIPASLLVKTIESLFNLVVLDKLTPLVAKTYPLANAPQAHRYLEAGLAFGKIVLQN
jgi:NADPH:quinone reductase-like Zn-dependent oxidoreductase